MLGNLKFLTACKTALFQVVIEHIIFVLDNKVIISI